MSDPKAAWLEELATLRQREINGDRTQALDDAMRVAIEKCRNFGATWQEIGDVMGTSRQYVNKRFSPNVG